MPGTAQHLELLTCATERQHVDRVDAVLLDARNVGKRPFANHPPSPHPSSLLVRIEKREAHRTKTGRDVIGNIVGVATLGADHRPRLRPRSHSWISNELKRFHNPDSHCVRNYATPPCENRWHEALGRFPRVGGGWRLGGGWVLLVADRSDRPVRSGHRCRRRSGSCCRCRLDGGGGRALRPGHGVVGVDRSHRLRPRHHHCVGHRCRAVASSGCCSRCGGGGSSRHRTPVRRSGVLHRETVDDVSPATLRA